MKTDPKTIFDYMKHHAQELGDRILRDFPALHSHDGALSPLIDRLKRRPFPSQAVAIMGTAARLRDWNTAAIIGEMGTGKVRRIGA